MKKWFKSHFYVTFSLPLFLPTYGQNISIISSMFSTNSDLVNINSYTKLVNNLNCSDTKNICIVTVKYECNYGYQMYRNIDNTASILNITIPFIDFFTERYIDKFLLHINDTFYDIHVKEGTNNQKQGEFKPGYVIYIFEETTWITILAGFRKNGISISGGSPTKRHILSPLQLRLAIFLISLYGEESWRIIWDSFHNKDGLTVKPQINMKPLNNLEDIKKEHLKHLDASHKPINDKNEENKDN